MTDDVPLVHVEDDVHALPAQPGALVEAVLRPPRRLHDREEAQPCSLGRSPSERKLELDPLVAVRAIWRRSNAPRRASAVVTATNRSAVPIRGARALRSSWSSRVLPHHHATAERERRKKRRPSRREHRRDEAGTDGEDSRIVDTHRVAQREPESTGRDDHVRRQHARPHGTTSPCRSASRAGPMPGIASSSSTEWNAPCCVR